MAKILIVDDDAEIREFIKFALKKEGYELDDAGSGKEALKKILEFKPDLMLLDIMMPILDGYSVCKILRDDPKYSPSPKIIILTARDSEWDRKLSELVEADSFVAKPFKPEDLISKIEKTLKAN